MEYEISGKLKSTLCLAVIAALLPLMSCDNSIFTDSRDGKKYGTIKISAQTWMAENLNYNAEGSKCYKNDPSNCQKYGRIYNWNAAMKACPSGWHLPSYAEWEILVDFAGGYEVAGKKLKARGGWETYKGESGNGTDIYGFHAMPGIYRGFSGVDELGFWWSSTEYVAEDGTSRAYLRTMHYYGAYVLTGGSDKSLLYSVRCVQD